MILLINVCSEKLHYFEFVKPIEDIIEEEFLTRNYFDVSERDLERANRVIICGTSLKDNGFSQDMNDFSWLLNFKKPVLGICAGFQIIGMVFGGKIKKKTEIGFFYEKFNKEFLGLKESVEVYHLHNNYVEFGEGFDSFCDEEITQAVKHKEREIYGVLFHPEVRNKEMIRNFLNG